MAYFAHVKDGVVQGVTETPDTVDAAKRFLDDADEKTIEGKDDNGQPKTIVIPAHKIGDLDLDPDGNIQIVQVPFDAAAAFPGGDWLACSKDVQVGWTYEGGKFTETTSWADSSLSNAQFARTMLLRAQCGMAIAQGYLSDALGESHLYPSTMVDQINMQASVLDSLISGDDFKTVFWVQDKGGAWSQAEHTSAQIRQAGKDGKTFVTIMRGRLASLIQSVMDAKDIAAVNAIDW